MKEKTYSLSEIKSKNKRIGHYFFQRGNPPVVAKRGNNLITRGYGGGFVLYKFYPKTGKIQYQRRAKSKSDF